MPNVLLDGVGGALGADLATASPLYISGDVVYVSSESGDASNDGLSRNSPLTTLTAGVSALSSGGVVVLLSDHSEEVAAQVTLAPNVHIVGEGIVSGAPTVKLTMPSGSASMISKSAGSSGLSTIRNIHFRAPLSAATPGAATGSYITGATGASNVEVVSCLFDMDQHSDGPGVSILTNAFDWSFRNCTFRSTETSADPSDIPRECILMAGNAFSFTLYDCVFDGGVTGFEDGSGDQTAFLGPTALTGFVMERTTLLRGANIRIAAGATGHIAGVTATGGSQIVWTD